MEQSEIQQRAIVDFISLSGEYCQVCNKLYKLTPKQFAGFLLRILPMLYLKVQQLPDYDNYDPDMVEKFVTEEEWKKIQLHSSILFGKYDQYYESDVRTNQFEHKYISENLADIYQDLKDFTQLVALGLEESLIEAIGEVKKNFKLYWGQPLVNSLRVLHHLYFSELLSDTLLIENPTDETPKSLFDD
ncbi:MAG TPA: DUF5063 domain-containing protein [Salinivirgaceae bacterium]|nr:DUF5063 domain-containing protein [Salinivirgaceae bacterium]